MISELATRMVVPLANYNLMKSEELNGLTSKVNYKGKDLLILIPQIASVSTKTLKDPIGSLSHLRDEIVSALDFTITGI